MNAPESGRHPLADWFDRAVEWSSYIYLRRVPILIGLFLVALPFISLLPASPLVSLLQNLFLLAPQGFFWSAVAAAVLSWSLLLTSRLVLLNGAARFGLGQRGLAAELTKKSAFTALLLALPLLLGPFTQAQFQWTREQRLVCGLATIAGILFGYLLAYVGLIAAILMAAAGTQNAYKAFPAPPFMEEWLKRANEIELQPSWLSQLFISVRKRLPTNLWAGYLDPNAGLPWGGHWLAVMFFIATALLTYGIDVYRLAYLGEATPIPALAFVLILLLNLNWVLSFLAFFLDRYRIPVLVPLLVLCVAGARAPSTDHYYSIQRGVRVDAVYPEQVLAARSDAQKPIVLIATAGGGIQAATWTAKVLEGLEQESRGWGRQRFSSSVALISSVSGGATGSMFYLNLFHPQRRQVFDEENFEKLTSIASDSSLDDIAWALVYRDLPRIFLPYLNRSSENRLFDRGYMLEESWRNRGNIQANLSDWRLGVREGLRPAAIFNSTVAETGEPIVLATTDVRSDKEKTRRRNFYELYPDSDLPVVTAVRLAATFPYVSPAARALSTKPEYHLVDGGYYDNYGVSSLIAWLDEAFKGLQSLRTPLPDALIIQIRSFPSDTLDPPTNKGWFFQTYAPVDALLNVRSTAQLIRDREELALFAERWAKCSSAKIRFATFEFPGYNAPLSWTMNPEQKAEIDRQWNKITGTKSPDLVATHCFFDPSHPDCQELLSQKGPW